MTSDTPKEAATSLAFRPLLAKAAEILAEVSFFFNFSLAIFFPLCLTLLVPAILLRANSIKTAMTTQAETIDRSWLYARGYTISQAARHIKRSIAHVHRVVNGERESKAVTEDLKKLPLRPLRLRESFPNH